LSGGVVGGDEEDVGVGGEVEEAELPASFGGVVDLVVVGCVGAGLHWLKEAQAMMNMVREKTAAMTVQQQSVHCLSFSSTGRLPIV
jgi:hypothetical protein